MHSIMSTLLCLRLCLDYLLRISLAEELNFSSTFFLDHPLNLRLHMRGGLLSRPKSFGPLSTLML